MSEMSEGGCICGAVRYRIEEDSPPSYACHCGDCRKRSGSAFAVQMPIWTSRFTIEGETTSAVRHLPSGATSTVHACAKCLTRLYSENDSRPGLVTVRAGTLDASNGLMPTAHMWVRSKLPWVAIPDEARCFETQPEELSEWVELLELERRPQ